MTRRPTSLSLLLVLSLALIPAAGPAQASPASGLRQVALTKGVFIGTMLDGAYSKDVTNLRLFTAACTEFNMLSPGNAMKFAHIHPAEDRYDWEAADRLYAISQACGMRFTGTPLVWQWQLPAWVHAYDGRPAKLRQILRDHVTQLVKHFAGKVYLWDVVNEAINPRGELRQHIWWRNLGPRYVEDAFRWARQADPTAKLYYNDFNADGMGPKGNGVYRWITRWLSRGVPIDGVGVQSHGPTESRSLNEIAENLRRYARLGLETRMSEISVPVGRGAAANFSQQASSFGTLARACFSAGTNCRMFTAWGVSDRQYFRPFIWRHACCGLLLDESYAEKPAYFAVRDALSAAA